MSRYLLLIPLLVACEDDQVQGQIPLPDPNMDLPAELVSLYAGQDYDPAGPSANSSAIACDLETGDWSLQTSVSDGATGAVALWWDLDTLVVGGYTVLVDDGGGSWSRTATPDAFGRVCEDGPFTLIVVPVGAGNVPGTADVAQYLRGDNAVSGIGSSSVNGIVSFTVTTDETVDELELVAINPYASFLYGPQALESDSPTTWAGEVNMAEELGATDVDSLWVGFAAFTAGELVGLADG